MNCIDAIEGNAKKTISRLYDVSVAQRFEDTEFIRCVKVILEATDAFLDENREITEAPEILHNILLAHARKLWIDGQIKSSREGSGFETDVLPTADPEYLAYFFDSVYQSGDFPL